FQGRTRHRRWGSDWSSDVCSSDLASPPPSPPPPRPEHTSPSPHTSQPRRNSVRPGPYARRASRRCLGLPPHPAERVYFGGRAGWRGFGPPPGAGDNAGLHELQAVEEAGDLLRGTQDIGKCTALV